MPAVDPERARLFAVDVVRRLREAGFEALWAGGCVRDRLMGLEPKDYDVATDATPEQVRDVFGRRRTLALGAAFGVITVLGPAGAGQVEVATFRRDLGYSDGRRPDRVTFCSAREDAMRRDFTINGMFFDPLAERVVDYVDGRADLARRVVRAIGDPAARIGEDKLRMLRAVRFASTFQFTLDPDTLAAVHGHASELTVVSAERIGAELRRMLVDRNRRRAVELLASTGLLVVVLPELNSFVPSVADCSAIDVSAAAWQATLAILDHLRTERFSVALAALMRAAFSPNSGHPPDLGLVCRRLRLSVADHKEAGFLLKHEATIRAARSTPWPQLQRILIRDRATDLLELARAIATVVDGHTADVDYAADRLAQAPEILNPPPLISGDDLRPLGIPSGPAYRRILDTVRDAQLDGQIDSPAAALALAARLAAPQGDTP